MLLKQRDDSVFLWLHSTSDPALAFPVVLPWAFYWEYEVKLGDDDLAAIDVENAIQISIMCVVNVGTDVRKGTINLFSPIVINNDDARAPSRSSTPPTATRPATRCSKRSRAAHPGGDARGRDAATSRCWPRPPEAGPARQIGLRCELDGAVAGADFRRLQVQRPIRTGKVRARDSGRGPHMQQAQPETAGRPSKPRRAELGHAGTDPKDR